MSARSHRREGFTWIELVIVLFVIAVLVALVLPAVQSDRRRPSRFQCLNNMRYVGLATLNYASSNSGILPFVEDESKNWPVSLMRFLDQPALARDIETADWSDEKAPYLQVFACPDDTDSWQAPGGLSYVVNGGYGFFPVDQQSGETVERGRHSLAQGWDGDGEVSEQDREITQATGVFWRPDDVLSPLTLDEIGVGDGTGNTLMLSENLHAGPWTTHDIRGLAFVVDRNRLKFDESAGALAVAEADLGPFAINGGKESNGLVPAPSSNHQGSVNVIWADGRGTTLSEDIDPLVYVRLLTPGGSLYGEQPVDDPMY
ncbi:MAG: DUF1559 domain-containing protein [Planctomycetota bacterium]|nr:DUF1559 domain-containing protein [Planctomycetaceae bacterium]MDQ3331053.1 DUF1559 domain-containing protein [Planctomycetota bacterium]